MMSDQTRLTAVRWRNVIDRLRAGRMNALTCVMTLALGFWWVHSLDTSDVVSFVPGTLTLQELAAHDGSLDLMVGTIRVPRAREWTLSSTSLPNQEFHESSFNFEPRSRWMFSALGVIFAEGSPRAYRLRAESTYYLLRIPFWLPVLLLVLPALTRIILHKPGAPAGARRLPRLRPAVSFLRPRRSLNSLTAETSVVQPAGAEGLSVDGLRLDVLSRDGASYDGYGRVSARDSLSRDSLSRDPLPQNPLTRDAGD